VKLLAMRARMEGFNTLDHWGRFDEANAELRRLFDAGELKYRSHVFEGLDQAVPALNALFRGHQHRQNVSATLNLLATGR
jgi:NADPH-dependent curcumin reductase CurA